MINGMNKSRKTTTKLVYCAMLIALSYVGAQIKIFPSLGSIAFDSMPGFFGTLLLGPSTGALVAGVGHIFTSMTSSFPLTVPMHLIVAVEMAVFAFAFGWIYKKSNGVTASIIAMVLNGPVSVLIAVPTSIWLGLPFNGWALFYAIILPLTIASVANVLLAYVVYEGIGKRLKHKWN